MSEEVLEEIFTALGWDEGARREVDMPVEDLGIDSLDLLEIALVLDSGGAEIGEDQLATTMSLREICTIAVMNGYGEVRS